MFLKRNCICYSLNIFVDYMSNIKFFNFSLKNIVSDMIADVSAVLFTLMLTVAFLSQTFCLYALQQRASIHNLKLAVFLECKRQIS